MRTVDLDESDVDTVLDLEARAFGPVSAQHTARRRQNAVERIADRRFLGVRDDDRLIAIAGIIDMAQWWHGRRVPMAGISSVAVAPEDRGRGAGPLLMRAVLERSVARGWPLSVLYPATSHLYRKVGYENAGAQHWYTFPAHALRALAPRAGEQPVPLWRAGPADATRVLEVRRAEWSADLTRAWLADGEVYVYLADDGLLAYRWDRGNSVVRVDYLIAASQPTLRTLWGVVASNASIADRVDACLSPDDPALWLTRDAVARPMTWDPWLLRVVDPPAAVAARGFPAGAHAEVTLDVRDETLSANTGTWRLTVADGHGSLERARPVPDAPRLGPRGLAALFAGTPLATLRLAELADGGTAHDELLDTAFACRVFTLDSF